MLLLHWYFLTNLMLLGAKMVGDPDYLKSLKKCQKCGKIITSSQNHECIGNIAK